MRLLSLFAALALCCTTGTPRHTEALPTTALSAPQEAGTNLLMIDTVVQIHVDIAATMITQEEDEDAGATVTKETPIKDGWVGSGVVYDKTDGQAGPVRSRILSANHVLDVPKPGTVTHESVEFLGMVIDLGDKRIDAVLVTLTTQDGRTCSVTPLRLGSSDTHDVATAEADCDAGRVAKIGTQVPVRGEKVTVVGHPLGVPLAMVTEGFVAGWFEGYLLTSAPAFGGNSGGPVFYRGEVIGLLVRGSRDYPLLTMTVSLEEVLKRIAETPALQ